jgi:hypothetical protein
MLSKHLKGLAGILLFATMAMAVTWQASSAPFSFPGVGVKNQAAAQSADLAYHSSSIRGIIDITCILPGKMARGQLSIYSINGKVIKSFIITPKSTAVKWNTASDNTPAGVYVAILKVGMVKKSIRIMLSGKGGN